MQPPHPPRAQHPPRALSGVMGECGASQAGTERDKTGAVPRAAGTATLHPWDGGEQRGLGGQQGVLGGVTSSKAQPRAWEHIASGGIQRHRQHQQSSEGQITTSLIVGELRAWGSPPGGAREELSCREPSQAPSGKGSPREGLCPPPCTQRAEPWRGDGCCRAQGVTVTPP